MAAAIHMRILHQYLDAPHVAIPQQFDVTEFKDLGVACCRIQWQRRSLQNYDGPENWPFVEIRLPEQETVDVAPLPPKIKIETEEAIGELDDAEGMFGEPPVSYDEGEFDFGFEPDESD
ncbi:MAG: hypothetical protein R3C28_07330 [Pirellulaceae bacterium]